MKLREQIKECYLITLLSSDRRKRYESHEIFTIFDGVDSRKNPKKVVEELGFKIDIKIHHWHMNKFNGSYGCYMSHYCLWEKINKKYSNDWNLILEDDVKIEDVHSMLDEEIDLDKFLKRDVKIINVNQDGVRGSDAYIIHSSACAELISSIKKYIYTAADRIIFQGNKLGLHEVKTTRITRKDGRAYIGHAPWFKIRDLKQNKQNTLATDRPIKGNPKRDQEWLDKIISSIDMKSKNCLVNLCGMFKDNSFLEFTSKFKEYDVFAFRNGGGRNSYQKKGNTHYINIREDFCRASGFSNFGDNNFQFPEIKNIDKAIFFLSRLFRKKKKQFYEDLWFIHDNVFFFSEKTLIQMDNRYAGKGLVCKNLINAEKIKNPHEQWRIFGQTSRERFSVPNMNLYYSNLSAFRINKAMVLSCRSYSEHHMRLFNYENYIPSYCILNRFTVCRPPHLRSLLKHKNSWSIQEVDKICMFSPVNQEDQKKLREALENQPW